MKLAIVIGVLMVGVGAQILRRHCLPLVPLMANGCNSCECPISGDLSRLSCSDKYCRNDDYHKLRHCSDESRSTWLEHCNRCWCLPGRGTVCETKACLFLRDGSD